MPWRNIVIYVSESMVTHGILLVPGDSGIHTWVIFVIVSSWIIAALIVIVLEWNIGILKRADRRRRPHVVLMMWQVTVIERIVHVKVGHGFGLGVLTPGISVMWGTMRGVLGLVTKSSPPWHHRGLTYK
jgi:hypothetical protein